MRGLTGHAFNAVQHGLQKGGGVGGGGGGGVVCRHSWPGKWFGKQVHILFSPRIQ